MTTNLYVWGSAARDSWTPSTYTTTWAAYTPNYDRYVRFESSSADDVIDIVYDWGDGTTDTYTGVAPGHTADHTYAGVGTGTYTITATATGASGTWTASTTAKMPTVTFSEITPSGSPGFRKVRTTLVNHSGQVRTGPGNGNYTTNPAAFGGSGSNYSPTFPGYIDTLVASSTTLFQIRGVDAADSKWKGQYTLPPLTGWSVGAIRIA